MNYMITIDADNRAVIEGTDISVAYILEGLIEGICLEDIGRVYKLTRTQAQASLRFALACLPQRFQNPVDYELMIDAASHFDESYFDIDGISSDSNDADSIVAISSRG
ncbi:MAG: DUF433 domain-containing protein [Chloroflexia bacterium]